jgi:hypothetical protein
MNRDNVPPACLELLRTEVLNHTVDLLGKNDATANWVNVATNDARCSGEALKWLLDKRFGEKRVSRDLSDPEANKLAGAAGYVVVEGATLSPKQWEKAKTAGLIKPAGQVTPSPKPYSAGGRSENVVPPEKCSQGMRDTGIFAKEYGEALLNRVIAVRIVNEPSVGWSANYKACSQRTYPLPLALQMAQSIPLPTYAGP